jgi:small nuclear ribonucleoprotein (snRNP)-like protein
VWWLPEIAVDALMNLLLFHAELKMKGTMKEQLQVLREETVLEQVLVPVLQ